MFPVTKKQHFEIMFPVGIYTGENAHLGVMVVGHVLHSNHKTSTALSLLSFPFVFFLTLFEIVVSGRM